MIKRWIMFVLIVCGVSIEAGVLMAAISFFLLAMLELNAWIIDTTVMEV